MFTLHKLKLSDATCKVIKDQQYRAKQFFRSHIE